MSVSVVLLTRDSAATLERCLASLSFADEVIALDGGSRDATLSILQAYGAKVYPQVAEEVAHHRGNFDVARNAGLDRARSDWILVVDSDEVVPPDLAEEVRSVQREGRRCAYEIPRTNLFWGEPSRILGDDYQLRLFPRGEARYEGRHLDCRPAVQCAVARLEARLVHHQCERLGPLLSRLWTRTSQRARVMREEPDETVSRDPLVPLAYHTYRYYYRELGADAEGWRGAALAGLYTAYPVLTQLKIRWGR